LAALTVTVGISREPGCDDLPLPRYMTPDAAGMDIAAAVDEPLTIAPGAVALVPAGFRLSLPAGYEGQLRPRSGLALRAGVTLLNAPGTIDPDYRGPVQLIMINHGRRPFTIRRGDRVAQLIVGPVARAALEERVTLDTTERGGGGFGHSGCQS